jgi:hypothetical protein
MGISTYRATPRIASFLVELIAAVRRFLIVFATDEA